MRTVTTLLILGSLALGTGCGPSGPETAPVTGRVTYAGKPVTEGTVMFWSAVGGTLATSQLGPEGVYQLKTHPDFDGAVLGTHRVTIRAVNVIKLAGAEKAAAEASGLGPMGSTERLEWIVPSRYEDRNTSPLTAEVKAGPNTIDFNLTAER